MTVVLLVVVTFLAGIAGLLALMSRLEPPAAPRLASRPRVRREVRETLKSRPRPV